MRFNVIRARGLRSCYSVKQRRRHIAAGVLTLKPVFRVHHLEALLEKCNPYESAFYGPVCDCRFHYIELLRTPVLILLRARGRIVGPRRSAVSCHVLPLHRFNTLAVAGYVRSLACVYVNI